MPDGCKTFIKNMEGEEAEESGDDRKQERKRTMIRKQVVATLKKTLRLLRYDDAVKGEDGWGKLPALRDRGLMLTEERLHGLSKGKGGGEKIRFETQKRKTRRKRRYD